MDQEVLDQVDRQNIVELACNLADVVSMTGEEKQVAEYLGGEFEKLGMQVEYQEVEEGRPNVIGRLKGTGGGATLMFCAHMDHFDNPQETVVEDDRIYGRGLVNMKAAFPCYIEAVDALQKAGVKLKGDLIISGVVGEIEKAQVGRFQGKSYRGAGVGAPAVCGTGDAPPPGRSAARLRGSRRAAESTPRGAAADLGGCRGLAGRQCRKRKTARPRSD